MILQSSETDREDALAPQLLIERPSEPAMRGLDVSAARARFKACRSIGFADLHNFILRLLGIAFRMHVEVLGCSCIHRTLSEGTYALHAQPLQHDAAATKRIRPTSEECHRASSGGTILDCSYPQPFLAAV